jgi:hypothetical protein
MAIPLSTFFPVLNPREYKVHLASWNKENQPLDVFVRDRAEWDGWNSWRSAKDEFNQDYIFSLIDFYPEPGIWLFGGIYKVLARRPENSSHSYTVERVLDYSELEGRLKIRFTRPSRGRSIILENYYSQMEVSELLKEPYTGQRFPGYENILLDFPALETIIRTDRPDWKAALMNVKGVYLIVDKSNGKKYVGSAYGDFGVWARWSSYVWTGHGWNDELTKLIDRAGIEYARQNFRLSLLEYRPAKTDDQVIRQRESYWKEAVLSRTEFGYNKN